ncbi:MAG: tetratricopeptide repeat protein [Bacteroidales bacterium]
MKIANELFVCGFLIFLVSGTFVTMAQKSENNLAMNEDTAYARTMMEKAKSYVSVAKFDSAIFFYKKASEIYRQNEVVEGYSQCLNYISEQYIQIGNLVDAENYAKIALAQSLKDSNLHEIGKAYNNLGAVSAHKGLLEKAVVNFENALTYWLKEETDDKIPIVVIYTNMCSIERSFGNYEKSLDNAYKAIEILLTLENNADEYLSYNYNNIGTILHQKGRYSEAIIYYDKALQIWLKNYNETHPIIPSIYNNLGELYRLEGDNKKALLYFDKALSVFLKTAGPTNMSVAICYTNMGEVLLSMKKYYEAKRAMLKALEIYKSINPEHTNLAVGYNSLSIVYSETNDFDSALYYLNESYILLEKNLPKYHYDLAACDFALGLYHYQQHNYEKAIQHYNLAAEGFYNTLGPKNPMLAKMYQYLGKAYFEKGNRDAALEYYQKSIISNVKSFSDTSIFNYPALADIYSKLYLISTLKDKAQALYSIYIDSPDSLIFLKTAYNNCIISIQLIDMVRNDYKTEDSKIFLNKQNFKIFSIAMEYALELYKTTGEQVYFDRAFEFSEKSKNIVLHASLMNLDALNIAGIPDTLLKMERNLKLDINFYDKQIIDEKGKEKPDLKKVDFWQNEVFNLSETHDSLIQSFEENFPEYYNLKYSYSITDIKTIQSHLSEKEALIEYALSDSALIYFVITKNTADVISQKTDNQFYTNIDSLRNFLIYKRTSNNASYTYHQLAYDLYDKLLSPCQKTIDGMDLIIIPFGKLGTIPFEALATSAPNEKTNNYKSIPYLINKHAISYGYSSTIWLTHLKRKAERQTKN